jgi:hypothetical protein
MRARPGVRPLIFGTGLFIAGLAVGAALASWAAAPTDVDVREGTTLAAFLPDDVMSLTYATADGMTTAQRSVSGTPFEVLSTFTDGRPTQRCRAPADMAGRLDQLTTLTARRRLSLDQREREFPVQLGVIDIRDVLIGEPFGPVLVFANKNRTAVAVILEGEAAEVTLQATDLDWLKTPCAGLADSHG